MSSLCHFATSTLQRLRNVKSFVFLTSHQFVTLKLDESVIYLSFQMFISSY